MRSVGEGGSMEQAPAVLPRNLTADPSSAGGGAGGDPAPELCVLPFAVRLNVMRDSLTGIMNWVCLLVTAAFWLRIGAATPLLHAFLAIEASICVLGIWWRRSCIGRPHMGQYGCWRESLAVLLRLNEMLLGAGTGWAVTWVTQVTPGDAHPGWPPWALAVRHFVLLLFASTTCAHLLTWAKPLRLSLAVAVHLLLAIALAQWNADVCTSACLSGPAAERLTHIVFQGMDLFRFDIFRSLAPTPRLSPHAECAAVLTHLGTTFGFLLPALLQAASEARLFVQHQRERQLCGLPPERGWQASMYAGLADLLDTLTWLQSLAALGMLVSITFMLSIHVPHLS